MSRGNRWYIFGRTVPLADGKIVTIPPGTEYEVVGFSFSKEAAYKRRAELDAKGRQGFTCFSRDRHQAILDAIEVYGVVVKGYVSPQDKQMGRAVVKSAVMRAIFCPYTGAILDMRRAVVVDSGVRSHVMVATHWDKVVAAYEGGLAALSEENKKRTGRPVVVYDGRELFRR